MLPNRVCSKNVCSETANAVVPPPYQLRDQTTEPGFGGTVAELAPGRVPYAGLVAGNKRHDPPSTPESPGLPATGCRVTGVGSDAE